MQIKLQNVENAIQNAQVSIYKYIPTVVIRLDYNCYGLDSTRKVFLYDLKARYVHLAYEIAIATAVQL